LFKILSGFKIMSNLIAWSMRSYGKHAIGR
jgi:hypothetical protein